MEDLQRIKSKVKSFLLAEFIPEEDANDLTDDVPLLSGGILNSIAVLKLVTFLEEEFDIFVTPKEFDAEHLDTLILIADLVRSKS